MSQPPRGLLHLAIAAMALLPFKVVAQLTLGCAAAAFIFQPFEMARPSALIAVIVVFAASRLLRAWHEGWQRHGMDAERRMLLVGCGNVGQGVALAFARAGWHVVTVDPSAALVPEELRSAPHVSHKMCVEDVPAASFLHMVGACREIIYAADCGNRDTYASDPKLADDNVLRFEAFARRVDAARRDYSARGADAGPDNLGVRVRYIGGSWTRRAPAPSSDPPIVGDASEPKDASACNPYEHAKNVACARARALAAELWLPITFCDWASIVPNLAPNFSIANMADEALDANQIGYTPGDYHN